MFSNLLPVLAITSLGFLVLVAPLCFTDGGSQFSRSAYLKDWNGNELVLELSNVNQACEAGYGAPTGAIWVARNGTEIWFSCSKSRAMKIVDDAKVFTYKRVPARIDGNSLVLEGEIQWCSWSVKYSEAVDGQRPVYHLPAPRLIVAKNDYRVLYELDMNMKCGVFVLPIEDHLPPEV